MTTIRVADGPRAARWRTDLADRLTAWYAPRGSARASERRLATWDDAPGQLFLLDADGAEVGHIALVPSGAEVLIADLWVDPEHRGRGYGRAALRHAERWATTRAGNGHPEFTRVGANVWTDDPALAALFAEYPLRSQRMIKELPPEPRLPDGIVARPLTDSEYDGWLANEIVGYAADLTGSATLAEADAIESSRQAYRRLLPDGLATAGQSFWMVESTRGGPTTAVAAVWLGHGQDAQQTFILSVEVRREHRGSGFGTAAMLVAEDRATAIGDRYLGLNVFGHNTVAMNLYRRMGYTVVDQTRTADLPR